MGGHMGAFGGLVEILRGRRGVRRDNGGVPSDEEVLPGAASAHCICLYFLASGSSGRQEAHGESKRALPGHQWGHGTSLGGLSGALWRSLGGAGASAGITVGFRATRRLCPELRQPIVCACISLLLAARGGRRLMGNPSAPFSATNGVMEGHMAAFGGLVEILRGRRGVRRDHGGDPSDEEVLPGAASAHRICLYFLASGRSARQEAHGGSKRALLGHQWDHGGSHGDPRGPCGDLEGSPGRPQGSRWGSERRGGFARSCVSP
eukprot:gene14900-biopygen11355